MISKDKKYRTESKSEVKIYEIYDYYIHGAYKPPECKEWRIAYWTIEGKFQNDGSDSCLDLIEISPYADLKIDDKVLVWDDIYNKYKCHFAGVNEQGKPMTWDGRRTSFTESTKIIWRNCEKYEENND